MDIRAGGPKTSETTARLLLIDGGTQAWLEPISALGDCDLVLSGQGDGKVFVDGSKVLTEDDLADLVFGGADNVALVNQIVADLVAAALGETIDNFLASNLPLNLTLSTDDPNPQQTAFISAKNNNGPGRKVDIDFRSQEGRVLANGEEIVTVGNSVQLRNKILTDPIFVNGSYIVDFDRNKYVQFISQGAGGPFLIFANGRGANGSPVIGVGNEAGGTVGLELMTQAGGNVTVNGKRVLTEDDGVGGGGSGIDQAAVSALIQTAINGPIAAQIQLSQSALLQLLNDNIDAVAAWLTEKVSKEDYQKLLDLISVKPGATLADVEAVWQGISDSNTAIYSLINILAGKPGGGGTVQDVANVFGQLPATIQALVNAAVTGLEVDPNNKKVLSLFSSVLQNCNLQMIGHENEIILLGRPDTATGGTRNISIRLMPRGDGQVRVEGSNSGGPARLTAHSELSNTTDLELSGWMGGEVLIDGSKVVTEDYLTNNVGPGIQQAIESGIKALPDKITLNVKSTNATDKVTIEAHQLTPHAPNDPRSVDVEISPYGDGKLTVGGKRVLTVDDALEAGGGGIDQAALEAAVQAATAGLTARIEALEAENVNLRAELDGKASVQMVLEDAEIVNNFADQILNTDLPKIRQDHQSLLNALVGLAQAPGTVNKVGTWAEQTRQDVAVLLDSVQNQLPAMFATKRELNDLESGIIGFADDITNNQLPNLQQMITDLVEYLVENYAEKQSLDALATDLQTAFDEFGNNVEAAIEQGFIDRTPAILEALSAHLENVLQIFGGGGGGGVTPAQITQLLADIARDYATKAELAPYATKAELGSYAKKDDNNQIITAQSIIVQGVQFASSGHILIPFDDEYGHLMRLIPPDFVGGDMPIVIVHTDLLDLIGPGKSGSLPVPAHLVPDTAGDRVLDRYEDIDWTVCPKVSSGAGTVEASLENGVLKFRGELKHSYSSTGTFVALIKLPDNFPKPPRQMQTVGMGIATGTSFRLNPFRIEANGTVSTCAGTGAFDTVYFDGLHFIY